MQETRNAHSQQSKMAGTASPRHEEEAIVSEAEMTGRAGIETRAECTRMEWWDVVVRAIVLDGF